MGQHASALAPGPSHQSSAVDCTNLFQAAELLACLVLESTPSCEPCVSSPGATIDSPAKIDSNQPLSLDSNPSMKETLGELKGKRRLQEAALQDLMMFYHLPDLCAAYLQLAHSGKILIRLSEVGCREDYVLPLYHPNWCCNIWEVSQEWISAGRSR